MKVSWTVWWESMPGKKLLICVASLMILVGTVSACAAISLSDTYYSLPSIPIAALAFCTAAILLVCAFNPWKNGVWLYIGTCVVVLFTFSSFAVVAQDYTVREERVAGGLRPIVVVGFVQIQHIDQDIALIQIPVGVYNETDSKVTIDKVVFDIYYQGPGDTEWHDSIHYQSLPAASIGSRKYAEVAIPVRITDREVLTKMNAIGEGSLSLQIRTSVWLDTKEGTVEIDLGSGG